MEEKIENPLEVGFKKEYKAVVRDEKGRIVGGVLNPIGHPKGQRNFAADFDEVVKEIAKLNKITINDARKQLLKVAYVEAKKGNYCYSKDIFDRYYGKAKENIEIEAKVEMKVFNLVSLIKDHSEDCDNDYGTTNTS